LGVVVVVGIMFLKFAGINTLVHFVTDFF